MHYSDKVGVAGCGRMGLPMLAALKHAGIDARGYDVRDLGVETDVDTFAKGLQTLITVVRDADETDAVLFDDQALVGRKSGQRQEH